MLDTLRKAARAFWLEFRYSHRGHKQGGRAAELALEREQRLTEKLDKTLDEMEDERVARLLAEAKTPAEKEAALSELMRVMGSPSTPAEIEAGNEALPAAARAAVDNEVRNIDARIEALREKRQNTLTELSLMTSELLKDINSQWPGILSRDSDWDRSDPLVAVIGEMALAAAMLSITIEGERCGVSDCTTGESGTDPVATALREFYASCARMEEYLQGVRPSK